MEKRRKDRVVAEAGEGEQKGQCESVQGLTRTTIRLHGRGPYRRSARGFRLFAGGRGSGRRICSALCNRFSKPRVRDKLLHGHPLTGVDG